MAKLLGTKRGRAVHVDPFSQSLSTVACKRCRSRKVKCGGEYPSCLGCVKADVPCVIPDPATTREYSREEVYELQQKVQRLEAMLAASKSPPDSNPSEQNKEQHQLSACSSPQTSRYVGKESGIRFFLSTLQASQSRDPPYENPEATVNYPTPRPSVFYHPPHNFPTREVAGIAINEYFSGFNMAHPILDLHKVQEVLGRVLSRQPDSFIASNNESNDLIQFNMAMALGSIRPFRQGRLSCHPFGFFTAALETNAISSSGFGTLEGIENLLLVAQFGVYYNIGCSIWELGRLCIRICVELNLHQACPDLPMGGTNNIDRCRKIFWESYLLDRFSSSTLGRPFAIKDSAIEAPLPEAEPEVYGNQMPRSASTFQWLIGLGRLTSDMHGALNEDPSRPKAGQSRTSHYDSHALLLLRNFHHHLLEWRQKAPYSESPVSLYEAEEYFNLLFQETRLRLLRSVIEKLSPSSGKITELLQDHCLQSACSIIFAFESLQKREFVTYSLTHTHTIFVASLVVAFVINARALERANCRSSFETEIEHWVPDLTQDCYLTTESAWEAIEKASDILGWLARNMSDVVVYARFVLAVKRDLEKYRFGVPDTNMNNEACRVIGDSHAEFQPQSSVARPPSGNEAFLGGLQSIEHGFSMEHRHGDLDEEPSQARPGMTGALSDAQNLFNFTSGNAAINDSGGVAFGHFSWPFEDVSGLEKIEADLSEFIWDSAFPWQTSISETADI